VWCAVEGGIGNWGCGVAAAPGAAHAAALLFKCLEVQGTGGEGRTRRVAASVNGEPYDSPRMGGGETAFPNVTKCPATLWSWRNSVNQRTKRREIVEEAGVVARTRAKAGGTSSVCRAVLFRVAMVAPGAAYWG